MAKSKESVRQRSSASGKNKPSRARRLKSKAGSPLRKFFRRSGDNSKPKGKIAKILSFPAKLIPKYFKESWAEIKLVEWPNRRQTVNLTFAVLIFSVVFSVIVAGLDYGFDKFFKQLILR
jgi:preprotein translocase SecE subunit